MPAAGADGAGGGGRTCGGVAAGLGVGVAAGLGTFGAMSGLVLGGVKRMGGVRWLLMMGWVLASAWWVRASRVAVTCWLRLTLCLMTDVFELMGEALSVLAR